MGNYRRVDTCRLCVHIKKISDYGWQYLQCKLKKNKNVEEGHICDYFDKKKTEEK